MSRGPPFFAGIPPRLKSRPLRRAAPRSPQNPSLFTLQIVSQSTRGQNLERTPTLAPSWTESSSPPGRLAAGAKERTAQRCGPTREEEASKDHELAALNKARGHARRRHCHARRDDSGASGGGPLGGRLCVPQADRAARGAATRRLTPTKCTCGRPRSARRTPFEVTGWEISRSRSSNRKP